jgi:hypothetical protein
MTATVTVNNLTEKPVLTAAYGNETRLSFTLTTNASGILSDSDHGDAIQIGDTVRIGIIPAGFEIHDAMIIVSDAFTASSTCSIGFEYCDGVDVTSPAQDAAYFVPATQALSSTAILRKTGIKAPAKLPKNAYVTLLWAGAAADSVGSLTVDILGIWTGLPA